jgi:uncharacterized membrane protein YfhO
VADRTGLLLLSELAYPGWSATIDGRPQPLLVANYAFRALVVPAGAHHVRLDFRPASLRLGGGLSILTAVALGLALVRERVRRAERAVPGRH